jgi:nitroimidazol reductase NimA-like FMN-containing flavoprotein (pyridoxamine 5'-phosphate oxidase superfamily)
MSEANVADSSGADPAAVATAVIESNRYMTLSTADGEGRPWATPVWFANDGREFIWISRPNARHSRNLAARPELAIVIFDSTVSPRDRQAVYVEAVAQELSEEERDRRIEVYSRQSVAAGLKPLTVSEVTRPAELRLYCAVASRIFVLEDDVDHRIPVGG